MGGAQIHQLFWHLQASPSITGLSWLTEHLNSSVFISSFQASHSKEGMSNIHILKQLWCTLSAWHHGDPNVTILYTMQCRTVAIQLLQYHDAVSSHDDMIILFHRTNIFQAATGTGWDSRFRSQKSFISSFSSQSHKLTAKLSQDSQVSSGFYSYGPA